MTAKVEIQGVTQRFGKVEALKDVDVTVEAGHFVVLLGPSGCGKTTLLSILGGFLTPSEGRVLIGGRDITYLPPAKRPTTTMFQDYALFPHMSLGANVGFGLRMRGIARSARDVRARELLALVGLDGAFHRKPHELSGGQRQRVALARALAVEPEVLLLDEPLGALDLKLRRQMQDELKAIQRRVGTTFIHVTHDQEEAMAIADEIIVMNHGVIEDHGPPERVYLRPRSVFAAGFMGEINMIDGTVEEVGVDSVSVVTSLGRFALPAAGFGVQAPAVGLVVKLGVRPEHIRPDLNPATALDLGQAKIVDEAFFGTHHRCHLALRPYPEHVFTAHLPQAAGIKAGDAIALRVDPAAVIVLAEGDG